MTLYQMMRTINKLKNNGINSLNKNDVNHVFGNTDDNTRECLVYLGCDVQRVADIFNVTLPDQKFTRDELAEQKRTEKFLASLI